MSNHQKDNAGWSQENGYEFHAETAGVISEGARSFDIFRKAVPSVMLAGVGRF